MSASGPAAVIVLAAGEGTRMASSVPKVLSPLCGRPMLGHVLTAAADLDPGQLIVVVGGRPEVAEYVARHAPSAGIVVQDYLGGTGHAVRLAIESAGLIEGTVVVLYGDTPLIRGSTLRALLSEHAEAGAAVTVLAARAADPAGYGRIVRNEAGEFAAIVEHSDASDAELALDEINSGMYAFDGVRLADAVKRVRTDNSQGEEYLTDAVSIVRADGYRVGIVTCPDFDEVQGVNDQAQLAYARRILNSRLLGSAMRAGATIADPAATWLDVGVTLAAGSVIGPGTQLEGNTSVAAGATVGPGCLLRDTRVGEGATVVHSMCESAVIGAGATVGPFAHLAPGMSVAPAGMALGSGPVPPGGPTSQGASREQGQ